MTTTEITTFDYGQLDGKTADFLRGKERNMREIVGKAYTELGRELKEAQEALAGSRYDGVFVRWCESIGYVMKQVYRLIQRYTVLTNCQSEGQRQLIEDLPVSLAYTIAAPSAEDSEPKREAKSAVLSGDITTLREYRELLAKLDAEQIARKKAEADYEVLRGIIEAVAESEREVKFELEALRARPSPDDGVYRIDTSTEVDGSATLFSTDVRDFVKRYAFLRHYEIEFRTINQESAAEYYSALEGLRSFVNEIQRVLSFSQTKDGIIIDM
ncbi:hypothetical protein ACFOQM_23660 [Paenibacillus sp. GCM10012307]|uniref:Uncharacterized protein n=1 Tax=Paenibacillus roseus TaxID=2798579 RepID=A0A934JBS0_9BACL|nr:hypothetical protein [Paenibacillus roseus]MBJ6364221.1 hypothetical protein [Paenibacillus roseus]